MPALSNPRYERFAQALFAGLAGETRVDRAPSTAYLQQPILTAVTAIQLIRQRALV